MPAARRTRASTTAVGSSTALLTMLTQIGSARTRADLLAGLGSALADSPIDAYSLLGFYGTAQEGIEILIMADRQDQPTIPTGTRYPRSSNPTLAHIALDAPTIFDNYATDPRADDAGRAVMATYGLASMALFPLIAQGEPIGLLSLTCRQQHTFTPAEIRTYTALAQMLAVALATITSQVALEAQVRRVETLYTASETIAAQRDATTILTLTTQLLVEQVGYRNAWLGLVDPAAGVVQGCTGAGVLLTPDLIVNVQPLDGPTMSAQVVRRGTPQVVDALAQGRLEGWEDHALAADLRTSIYVPLRAHETVVGVLGIGSSSAQVDPGEVALLAAFATQVATALERIEATVAQQAQVAKLEAAYAQQEALLTTIRELATPVLPIYQGRLCHIIVDLCVQMTWPKRGLVHSHYGTIYESMECSLGHPAAVKHVRA